ncbi:hypothetical protein Tco_1068379 [Tanacetum coccineum]|uniref:Uncharacterized protein n=1 Tax=Tanacetum coccineum TaxID=301880 RepID=A0ABQ5HHH3_9ASTR
MKHQAIYVTIMATFALLLLSFTPTRANRILEGDFHETWMQRSNPLLPSLQSRSPPVQPPGNGCNLTGNGGNLYIMSRKIVGRPIGATAPPPPESSQSLVQIGEATS